MRSVFCGIIHMYRQKGASGARKVPRREVTHMKKIISVLLCLALLLGALTGCGDKNKGSQEPQNGTSQEQTSQEPSGSGTAEPAKEEPPEEDKEPEPEPEPEVDLRDADLKDFMAGSWEYEDLEDAVPSLRFEFGADGRYTAERDAAAEGKTYSYSGAWDVVTESVASQFSSVELPLLKLGLFSTDDPGFKQASSLGDYIIDQKTICDGSYMVYLILYSGEGIFLDEYDTYSAVMTRNGGYIPARTQEPKKNANIQGVCWKLRGDEKGALIWIDEKDYTTMPPSDDALEAVPYRFTDDPQIFLSADYIRGGELVDAVTDSEGRITYLGNLIMGFENPDDIEGGEAEDPAVDGEAGIAEYTIEGKEITAQNDENTTVSRVRYQLVSAYDDSWPRLAVSLEGFNSYIEDYAKTQLDMLKDAGSDLPPEHLKEIAPLTDEMSVNVHRHDSTVFSFEFGEYYYAGGAHPSSMIIYYNIDTQTGDYLKVEDIITDQKAFLQMICDELKANWEYVDEPSYIGNLLITEDGLIVLYNTYELGSYAAGGQELHFPLSEIKDVVNTYWWAKG